MGHTSPIVDTLATIRTPETRWSFKVGVRSRSRAEAEMGMLVRVR
jgi:hypothetical protein